MINQIHRYRADCYGEWPKASTFCGLAIHRLHTTSDDSLTTCKNCLRAIAAARKEAEHE